MPKIFGRMYPDAAFRNPWTRWSDSPRNPLIAPDATAAVVADPAVVTPENAPDGRWHMIICGSGCALFHYVADDGLAWRRVAQFPFRGFSPFLLKDGGRFHLYYQRYDDDAFDCRIHGRSGVDLEHWGEESVVLTPGLPWEDQEQRPTVRNACVVKVGDRYRLYYSGGVKIIPDLKFEEPACIGVAESARPEGPFAKRPEPLLSPDPDDPWRNIGAGAMKVLHLPERDVFLGFNNGIYWRDGRSGSALHLLVSRDGYDWFDLPSNPFLSPEPGWKESLVYQICPCPRGDGSLWAYYNARQGWEGGVERIGLAVGRGAGG